VAGRNTEAVTTLGAGFAPETAPTLLRPRDPVKVAIQRAERLLAGCLLVVAAVIAVTFGTWWRHPTQELPLACGVASCALALLVCVGVWRRLVDDLSLAWERSVDAVHATRHGGERRIAALMGGTSDVVLVLNSSRHVTYASTASRQVLNRTPSSLRGMPVTDLLADKDAERLDSALAGMTDGSQVRMEFLAQRGDGTLVPVEATISSHLQESVVAGYVIGLRDMSELTRYTAELARQSLHDPLTGLPNRRLFAGLIAGALRDCDDTVVIVADIDGFKAINSRHGQAAGDAVLIEIGQRLCSVVDDSDVVARLGGDEFGILLRRPDDGQLISRLLAAASAPITVGGREVTVRVSMGLADLDSTGSVEDVLRQADIAMYWAKESGRSSLARYEPDLHHRAIDQMVLRQDLERAIRADELRLVFQPILDLNTGLVHGVEALARWDHPLRGLVPPDEFVPLAEQSGMIVELGEWILREACEVATRMQDGGQPVMMSVNISALQLSQPDFVVNLLAVLDQCGLDPRLLLLEITESAVVVGLERVIPRLAALRCLGVHISVDDFGTGYSSLNYLSRLPLDELKVDKSFIDRVTWDAPTQSVVRGMLEMSNSLGLITVGEGIETQEQADWLRDAGCALGQGYLWAAPREEDDILRALRDQQPGPASQLPAPRQP
jgi:diguanylate cyclase (GGDEF)-like protein/PAS domain S-box-containing protein